MPTRHLTLRIPLDMFDKLTDRSRRAGQTRSRLAQTLLEEGLRMEAHPGIVFRSGPAGRRPGLANGPDIWEIARLLRESGLLGHDTLQTVAERMSITREQAAAASRYYAAYRDEIDEWIRGVDKEAESAERVWRREQDLLHA